MSGYRRLGRDLFDALNGAWLGKVDFNGREQLVPATAAQFASAQLWAASKVSALTPVAQAMRELTRPALQPVPGRVRPHQIATSSWTGSIAATTLTVTGTPVDVVRVGMQVFGSGVTAGTRIVSLGTGTGAAGTYGVSVSQTVASTAMTGDSAFFWNPAAAGAGTGTLADPFKEFASYTGPAGSGLLLAANATKAIAGALVPPTSGTAAAPIVLGIYEPTTGYRISGRSGAATIDCQGTVEIAIYAVNTPNVCIDGWQFINKGPSSSPFILFAGAATVNSQVLNCTTPSSAGGLVKFDDVGAGCVTEGCGCDASGTTAISMSTTVADAVMTCNFNAVKNVGAGGHGILVQGTAVRVAATVASNSVDFVQTGVCIWVIGAGGAPKIFRNTALRGVNGVVLQALDGGLRDFSGALMENNVVDRCEQNMKLIQGTGSYIFQHNSLTNPGTRDGINPITANNYSRCLEIVAPTYLGGASPFFAEGGVIRFNYCAGAKMFISDGSEAVGIGLDNYSRNLRIYGNYIENCEGNGIQGYLTTAPMIYGNILRNNLCCLRTDVAWQPGLRGQIHLNQAPVGSVFNNTIIATGLLHQHFGYSDSPGGLNPGTDVFNNIMVGHTRGGVSRNIAAGQTTERYNLVIGSPQIAINAATGLPTAAGTASVFGVIGDIDMNNPFFTPTSGGAADGSGAAVPPWATGFAGQTLADRTPRGAVHATY